MLEDQVANLLQRYLGNYVRGLNKEALKISVWKGDVELKNMQLKPEALNALKLPVKVKAGFLGSVRLKVPWSRLGQDPVLVYLDRIYILAEPATEVEGSTEDAVQQAKKSRVHEMEMKLLERAQQLKSEMNKSWLGSLISTIIGNLKLSISNIHVRYEDLESNPGHPFSAGVMLGKLSAATVDDKGAETFVTGVSLDGIQKSVELDQLALYLDSDITPWHLDKPWEDLPPSDWVQVFRCGTVGGKPADCLIEKHSYVLQPVSGSAKYSKLHGIESVTGDQPVQKAVVNLDDVTLCLTKDGYRDVLKLADNFASFNQRLKNAHYRPHVPVKSSPRSWWKYAFRAVSDQMKKASGKLSWEQILRYSRMRKRYISLYASVLKADLSRPIVEDNKEIEEMDKELDINLIIQWRMVAHKFVEQSVESEAYLTKQKAKKSWWPLGWNGQSPKDENGEFHFTDDDWEQLNRIIGYKEGADTQSVVDVEKPDVVQTFLEIHMKRNATKLGGHAQECLAELSCNDLDCFVKLYEETKVFDLKLGSYRLSSPNGLLAESATSLHSLSGVFCYKPFDAKVDWSLVVKASPCYMTYLKDSIDEVINFFETNDAVSPAIALETAAAVQMTIDEVKRSAQKQVNRALKDHARFFLDLDIAAPKVKIPTAFCPDNVNATNLLLDFGNLMIRSQDDYERKSVEELDMYLQFDLVLSDVSAFLVDGDYHWSEAAVDRLSSSKHLNYVSLLPVVDKCGVILRLQQIRLENSSLPSTRLSLRLPSLGFHFSPARYHRLMHVVEIFQEDSQKSDLLRPWDRADFEGWLSLLTRKGMGNREAVWQRRYICLVGSFFYVLENPGSKTYNKCISLRGKQVQQLPAELVGGIPHVFAICGAAHPINKVVEDVNALILRCDSDDGQRSWQKRLQAAIYLASDSTTITTLSESSSDHEDSETDLTSHSSKIVPRERVFLTGVLDELKICFNYSQGLESVLLAQESRLFEFRAIGGQVELSIREKDLLIGTVLKSLEIEDLVACSRASQTCFLVRSVIRSAETQSSFDDVKQTLDSSEGDDKFYEASENLVDSDPGFQFENSSYKLPNFSHVAGLLPSDSFQTRMKDSEATESLDSFIKAQIVIYDQNSSLYNNVDMQVMVTLATLSFFCRRPTIVAVMDFVNAIKPADKSGEPGDNSSSPIVETEAIGDDVVENKDSKVADEPTVKGLLGKGKSRVIFDLILKMARAQISLMNENGSKLATLSQDNLFTNIKVFPSSFSINAALGNLRISDDSLYENHAYFWMCDMRNPGGSSFVELLFSSFNVDDDDYEGYEYSLFGQLSEVRIVYLNRFVQEVASYFLGLVPNNSKGIVKVKDQNTNSEKWFTTSEIEGSPALKLDLSLRKPIILMPRRTDSPDYLKLDVVHITVRNTCQWLSGSKDDIHSVHMDIMTVQVEDINLNVGTGTELSESIIQDVKGMSLVIRRSLRDLSHQVPNMEVAIKIEKLKAALSNREYQIVTECATSNISEIPRIIPPLKHVSQTIPSDVIEPVLAQDPGNVITESQNQEVWISMEVTVIVNLVELSLHAGLARDTSLATMQIMGLWLLFKSDNQMESFLSATLKGFTVIDDREGTADEFRLAIGMPHDIGNSTLAVNENQLESTTNVFETTDIKPVPTMLILDAKLGQHSTTVSLCVQRPQMLVALDFLLAVVEFFVPSVGNMLSNDENKNPIDILDAIILDQPVYRQTTAEISLSPLRPLVADHESFDHFIYDGCGGIIYLRDRQGFHLSSSSKEPVIYVGHGKKLQFRNVLIKDGRFLDSCIWLGSYSGYSALRDDQVLLEAEDKAPHLASSPANDYDRPSQDIAVPRSSEFVLELQAEDKAPHLASSPANDYDRPSQDIAVPRSSELVLELQAIGPELTFYNTSKDVGLSPVLSNKLLHAQLDAFSRFVMKGDTMEATVNVLGFMMESNGINILEPFDTSLKFSNASGKTNIHASVSNIFMNCTFSILKLFLAVEEDILTFLQRTSQKITVTCSQFDKVGTIRNVGSDQIYAFWRPRAPPGFAILGDYLTPLDKPPTKGVVAVNTNLVRVKRPISYKLIWPPAASFQEITDSSSDGISTVGDYRCSIWLPEAPKGYVAMGCVVAPGNKAPPPSSTFCIWSHLVSPCSLRDCVTIDTLYQSSLAFWRVDNCVGSFLPVEPSTLSPASRAFELRHIKFGLPEPSFETSNMSNNLASSPSHVDRERAVTVNSGRRFEAVASFQLIWWNRGTSVRKKLSIWRPVVPQGMVYFGDIAVRGHEPPSSCVVLHDSGDGELFKAPLEYQLVGQIKKQRGAEGISFWMPLPPPGFVSLGCVASKGSPKQNDFSVLRCMRSDMVTGDQFLEESVWDTSDAKFGSEHFSLWTVDNKLGTFLVRSGFKKPPRRFALKLADPSTPSGSDDTVVDAEIGTFSISIFDDYGGLMVPLFNLSLSGVVFSLRGRADFLASTVSFSLNAKSFNDTYDAWEPLIEPVDGFVRYEYNINSASSPSQLRLTATGNLNLNVSVSNCNMIIQAYASWSNLSSVHTGYRKGDAVLSTVGAIPVIDVHHRANFYILPRNKLGRDIFVRATETRGLSHIIRLTSGEMKPVKVPVLNNMLDSHSKGKICAENRKMVTVIIADGQFPKTAGLASNMYTSAIRLVPSESMGAECLIHQQSARTSGAISVSSSSGYESVNWSEIFFFKVETEDNYSLELIVTDMGRGQPIGFFTCRLKEIARKVQGSACQYDYQKHLTWIDLHSAKSMDVNQEDEHDISFGRLRFAVLFSPSSEVEETGEFSSDDKQSGFIQISPSVEGPWTTVRLNYAAPAACWRLGNDVVASEVIMNDSKRFLNIRTLVSVHNNTDFVLDLRLVPKSSDHSARSLNDVNRSEGSKINGWELQTEEFFETEKYDPTLGWICCANNSEDGDHPKAMSRVILPSGWVWLDDWHLDTSSVSAVDGWVYSPDVKTLKWPESFDLQNIVNGARQRRWIRNRKPMTEVPSQDMRIGSLEPGDTLPLPLPSLTLDGLYVLQVRPLNHGSEEKYSWSYLVERLAQSEGYDRQRCFSGLNVSSLSESDELLYCEESTGTSSNAPHKLWFGATVQAAEIAKDIHSDPIQDWSIVIKAPLCISNYLPLSVEYSIYDIQASGHFLACARGIFDPGETVKIHTADIRNLLYLSMLPQRGWLPVQEAVLISHPSGLPSKTTSLRSSITGRIVHLILEQNYETERPLLPRAIRVYAPYWFSVARCPPLTCRMVDLSGKKQGKSISLPFQSRRTDEEVLGEITAEEIYEGHTIASALNFKLLSFSVSITESERESHFGPPKDLSPLGDMDGSLDICAYDADGNCMHLFISTKPCPYQSVPSKVISIRPFMTFTNRLGQDIFIKLNSEDQQKVLRSSDTRVSFMHREAGGPNKIQVRLEETEWSFPVQITKEDTFFLVLRTQSGRHIILRAEVRGFEEGSRFIVVFRLGPTDGPFRVENRTSDFTIRLRQAGFGEDAWVNLEPLSTINFSWEDPYGQKFVDAQFNNDLRTCVGKLELERIGVFTVGEAEIKLQFNVVQIGYFKVVQFKDYGGPDLAEDSSSLTQTANGGNSSLQEEARSSTAMELIVELGVVGISVVDHRPKELLYLYLERVFLSYSTGYDGGTTSRLKLIFGYLQLDNQLPLTLMPVLLAPEPAIDMQHPVFKMTITARNENADGVQVYQYIYIRVSEKVWRIDIHEPIMWALVSFFNNIHLDRLPDSSNVTEVDPEIRLELVDISEVRLKVSLETAPAERPQGVLGIWSPVLSALGNAFKIQVHLRRVMQRDRFMRKSSVVPAIQNRIWRDLIHNPLHLLFSVDILGMTSSTLASLGKGFAKLSTDGQFLQLRSKQVSSRRITGVGQGIIQGTEALAQGFAFGVSGVVTKPMESARENGLLGLAHGLGRAFLGFIVQPVSGALDFFSLTVDGIGASCSKCLEVLNNKVSTERIRCPRAIHADCILREYSEREAVGQMILYLGEASRRFGCTEIFKEPSKYAWSDYYEAHFMVPYQRIVLVTNKRVMLLQCRLPEKMAKKPSKIMWDVPWEELMSLELAKAGCRQPSHLLLHLKSFRRSENFVRVIKCHVEEPEETEPQAVRICAVVRRIWKAYFSNTKSIVLKVPASQGSAHFASNSSVGIESPTPGKAIIKSRGSLSSSSNSDRFVKHSIDFQRIWSSEQELKGRCRLSRKQVVEDSGLCSIWRPICPDGYISIGDVAHVGGHPPNVAAVYRNIDKLFAVPIGYDLVWRNCLDDYKAPLSIWHPRAPEGFVSLGCIAVAGFEEPHINLVFCVAESVAEQTEFEEQKIWTAPNSYPWACHIYQVKSEALHFVALRQTKEESDWKPMRIVDDPHPRLQSLEAQ